MSQLKNKKILLLLTLVLAVALVVAGCGGGTQTQGEEKLKVAFMYVGPIGDGGWSYAHDQGRLYLEEQLSYVETSYIESVPENATAEQVLNQLVAEGNKVIFATSFGFMDHTKKVAEKYPDVVFLHCSGYETAENMGTYFGRMYQARYLTGIAAGKSTESNLIGYVAAFPIPEVIRGINAFTLGVRSVNPEAKVKVIWTNTWYDPASEKDAAKVLLDAGADVITQHQDTPGPQQAAQERGKLGIGYNSDMSAFAPNAVMTSAVWNWGPYYVDTVKAVHEGTWSSNQYWGPMNDNIVDLAPYGPMVSDEIKQMIRDKQEKILDGSWDVFYGPIKNQQGELEVAEGEAMNDEEMLNMMWFVEGVEGNISN